MVKAKVPNPNPIDKITRVVALALLLVEIPPSKIPADKKINPTNIVRPVKACIPSMNVCAMPAYDNVSPATPIAVNPIPRRPRRRRSHRR